MSSFKQQVSIDNFFYYGLGDIHDETEHDLMVLLLQPKRSMFYNRTEGSGVTEYLNYPNALSLQIGLRYDIANSIARRNQNTVQDRRVLASQFTVQFNQDLDGNLDVSLYYILSSDYKTPKNINLPVGKA